jgi:hypothetical protein
MNRYENLANAIVLRAVADYRNARRALEIKPGNATARVTFNHLIEFFQSDYFYVLSNLDPGALLERLDREVDT